MIYKIILVKIDNNIQNTVKYDIKFIYSFNLDSKKNFTGCELFKES